jgi:hypothetical protein
MPRAADRLISKFTGSSESAPEGNRSVRRQLSNAVYIYRHPIGWVGREELKLIAWHREGIDGRAFPLLGFLDPRVGECDWQLAEASGLDHPSESLVAPTWPPECDKKARTDIKPAGQPLPPPSRTTLPSNPPSPPLDPTFEELAIPQAQRCSVPAISVAGSSAKGTPERQIKWGRGGANSSLHFQANLLHGEQAGHRR